MARTALHRAPSSAPRLKRALRNAGTASLAGAASLATVGLTAPAAQAHNHNVWDRVAECESSGNWHINTGNGFYGGLQFWQPTWVDFGGQEFAAYAHQATKLQQITVAQRVLEVQGPGAWPVCSVRAGLTRENGALPYPGDSAPEPPPGGEVGTWWVASPTGANIRSGPGTNYAIVGGAAQGTRIDGTMSAGWVRLADGRGWISGATLTTSDPAPGDPNPGTTYVVRATNGANIRSGPSLQHGIVGAASDGSTVSGTMEGGWLRLPDGRGWISGTVLRTPGEGTPAPPETATWRVSASGGANIRSGPGTSHSIIGGLAHGTQVRGTLSSNGWVDLDGRAGWVYAGILTRVG